MKRILLSLSLVGVLGLSGFLAADTTVFSHVRTETTTVTQGLGTGSTIYRVQADMAPGTIKQGDPGKAGYLERTIARVYVDDVLQMERFVSEKTIEPEPAEILISSKGFTTNHTSFTLDKVMTMESTAYTPDAGLGSRATFRTATGRTAKYGVIAVDPRVIKLNTLVYVEGYGLALACDTGGAIKGNIVDVCVPDMRTARNWGRRHIKVHVFQQKPNENE